MAEAVSTPSNGVTTKYHTVNVCANLPKVGKNYPCNKPEDLPPDSYWKEQITSSSSREYKTVTHILANGPRKSEKIVVPSVLYSLNFRHIIMQQSCYFFGLSLCIQFT